MDINTVSSDFQDGWILETEPVNQAKQTRAHDVSGEGGAACTTKNKRELILGWSFCTQQRKRELTRHSLLGHHTSSPQSAHQESHSCVQSDRHGKRQPGGE